MLHVAQNMAPLHLLERSGENVIVEDLGGPA
jgi:hypothetical protein